MYKPGTPLSSDTFLHALSYACSSIEALFNGPQLAPAGRSHASCWKGSSLCAGGAGFVRAHRATSHACAPQQPRERCRTTKATFERPSGAATEAAAAELAAARAAAAEELGAAEPALVTAEAATMATAAKATAAEAVEALIEATSRSRRSRRPSRRTSPSRPRAACASWPAPRVRARASGRMACWQSRL